MGASHISSYCNYCHYFLPLHLLPIRLPPTCPSSLHLVDRQSFYYHGYSLSNFFSKICRFFGGESGEQPGFCGVDFFAHVFIHRTKCCTGKIVTSSSSLFLRFFCDFFVEIISLLGMNFMSFKFI